MRKYYLLALFSMVYMASFASQSNHLQFTGYFVDGVSNQPLAGFTIGIQATFSRTWVSIYTGQSGPGSPTAAVFSGVTDNNGYLSISGTFNTVDDNGGQYYLVDGGPDKVYYNVTFSGWSVPYAPTGFGPWTASLFYVNGFPQNLFTSSLITPQNSNSLTITQNGINMYLGGCFHDLDSRYPHGIGTQGLNFNFPQAPSIAFQPTQNTCSVNIPFTGNVTFPVGGQQQSLSVAGALSFVAQLTYAQLGNGYQILVLFPAGDPSLSWVHLSSVSLKGIALDVPTYQALLGSLYASSFNNAIHASGPGGYIPLGNPLMTGMFGGLYTELTLPTVGTFTTYYNASNPGLSSFTVNFLSRLSFMGLLQ
jgi:hypothetical protein